MTSTHRFNGASQDRDLEPEGEPGFPMIRGMVRHGQQLGRQLGFPTANVALEAGTRFRFGVYATRSRLQDGRLYPGVANIGCNPTTGLVLPRLEVFLFEFDEDIYDQMLVTALVAFLRPELKFAGLDPLIEQIRRDVIDAKRLLIPSPHRS